MNCHLGQFSDVKPFFPFLTTSHFGCFSNFFLYTMSIFVMDTCKLQNDIIIIIMVTTLVSNQEPLLETVK